MASAAAASSTRTSIVSLVRFVRDQLNKDFQTVNHLVIIGYNDDDKAEEVVSKISEHAQALIMVARLSGKYPREINDLIDDDDLANILTKGHLYGRSIAADVEEIEDELF